MSGCGPISDRAHGVSRQALLVLGMHRGGTSATAGLLAQLGVQPPATLMPADRFNPEGYWESQRLWGVHERILQQAGSRWDSYSRLDVDCLDPLRLKTLMVEARQGVHSEFGDAAQFVIKDPRVCRFVPFWLRVLEEEGVAASAVLVLRSPVAIAQSLAARDTLEPELSVLIWLRHMLDAEFHTRHIRRSLVRYEDLVEDWRSVANRVSRDIHIQWHPRPVPDDEELHRFVQSDLQHHRGNLELSSLAPVVADWIHRTSAALDRLHDNDSRDAGSLADLDAIRLDFDRTTAAFAGSDRALGELQRRVEWLDQHSVALRQQLDALEQDRDTLRRHVESLEQERKTLQRTSETLDRDRTALQRAVSEARQDADALRQSASWRVTAPLRALYRLFR